MVFRDSELIVNHVRGISAAKKFYIRSYRYRVWDLTKSFEAFNIQMVPREQNEVVDHMAIIGSQFDLVSDLIDNTHFVLVIF